MRVTACVPQLLRAQRAAAPVVSLEALVLLYAAVRVEQVRQPTLLLAQDLLGGSRAAPFVTLTLRRPMDCITACLLTYHAALLPFASIASWCSMCS